MGGAEARHRRSRVPMALVVAALALLPHGAALCVSRPAERAKSAMVAAAEQLAAAEGVKALREGGNAVDAAVTTAFALAVTHPWAGNLGGGGYILFRPATGDFLSTGSTASALGGLAGDLGIDVLSFVFVMNKTYLGGEAALREAFTAPVHAVVSLDAPPRETAP